MHPAGAAGAKVTQLPHAHLSSNASESASGGDAAGLGEARDGSLATRLQGGQEGLQPVWESGSWAESDSAIGAHAH